MAVTLWYRASVRYPGTEGGARSAAAGGAARPRARGSGIPREAEPQGFGALLREHRLAAGLTQEALAERAGVSPRAIQHLEASNGHPARATLQRLVRVLALAPAARAPFEAAAAPRPR